MAAIHLNHDAIRELVRPGISGWLALEVMVGDEVYHLHLRREPDAATHTTPAEWAADVPTIHDAAEVFGVVLTKLLGGAPRKGRERRLEEIVEKFIELPMGAAANALKLKNQARAVLVDGGAA